ncbi:MAG: thioredoxin family protein [Deltaproteobacteria bacterium]|nr:thioredoxin family protein [Deltaproteobacteria bacterium]
MLFYSNRNQASLNTRIAVNEFLEKHKQPFKIKVNKVNYDRENNICRQYGVTGIPTLLVFSNQELIGCHYGEITYEEFKTIIITTISKNNVKGEIK